MHKPQLLLRNYWKKSVSNIIILLFGLLAPIEASDIHISNYVVPVYPKLLNKARMQALFLVEINVKAGRVDTISILSQRIRNADNSFLINGAIFDDFIKSINDALVQWTFTQSDKKRTHKFRVSVRFLLTECNAEEENARFRFIVQEKDNVPSMITIEADRIGPDSFIESLPLNK